ncbi:HAD-IA family hydrolase [Mycolicibacterium sp. CBMA 226]|uniref:HAD-IA family hydrolase n=1 Tax=Mycolicibacterium sp. CBMA 226 TaxID=2606611 RepID=UPI0012DCE1D6|nr:HAD-IA family hydrolase [Mycolicibacterium sp. CBMA 226]MUL79051.1 HAD-IA family hydrolase [Mycolicibacterium sp. CBMA 226]QGW61375.1 Beta-phosphoglucomutase [Mycolicibacterium sp.]
MTQRALVFDCDGVLADTEKDGHRVAFNQAFEEFNLPLNWSPSDYGPLLEIGGGKERIRADLSPQLLAAAGRGDSPDEVGELVIALHRRKTELYRQMVNAGQLPGRSGVARLAIEALRAGWRIAVASTSAQESVRAVAEHVFPPAVIEVLQIFAGDIVARKKPAPDIYLTAARELGVEVENCVAVEDSPIGCASAVAAGMTTVVTESQYTAGEPFEGAALVVSELGDPLGSPAMVRANPAELSISGVVTLADLEQLLQNHQQIEGSETTR